MTRTALVLMLVVMVRPLTAQTVIPNAQSCRSCSITVTTTARIGKAEGPGSLGEIVIGVGQDSRGRYWIFEPSHMPQVFNRDGSFVGTVGREGDGPGEMRGPSCMVTLPGDSAAVVAGKRLNIYNADLKFVRMVTLPSLWVPSLSVLRWPDALLINTYFRSGARAGSPLHVIDATSSEGRILRSFGSNGRAPARDEREIHQLVAIAPSKSGAYWTASRLRYEITKWDASNRPVQTLARKPEWFPGQSDGSGGGLNRPPSPKLIGVHEDNAGLLWTYTHVAAPTYQAVWKKVFEGKPREVAAREIDDEMLYDTRVEVIDLRAGRMVTTTLIDRPVTSVLSNGDVAVVYAREDGSLEVRTLKLTLKRK